MCFSFQTCLYADLLRLSETETFMNDAKTSKPQRRIVGMYASTITAFTHLYTHDLDL